jgi:hypothetical protein
MKKEMSFVLCALLLAGTIVPAAMAASVERSAEQTIAIPGTTIELRLREELLDNGELATVYQISRDGSILREARASYELGLRYAHFDPLERVPAVESILSADESTHLFIVQFHTQPLVAFQEEITRLGGQVRHYMAQFAYLVEMDEVVLEQVSALPYVRWIGAYHPAYRLDEATLQNLRNLGVNTPAIRYNIQVLDVPQKAIIVDRIRALGARIDNYDAGKMLVEATLNGEQLVQVARFDEVNFIDVWSPYEADMDIVREIGGANYLENMTGFTGEDVRGEIFDGGCQFDHQEFQVNPIIGHGPHSIDSHGTACMGVNFATGVVPQARGLLPDGQGIFADYSYWGLSGNNRYVCASELVDPGGPYQAVFQTASVSVARTTQYTTVSAEGDWITFDFNLVACQSQSNAGTQMSRPYAWSKNYVSGGALYHYNTIDRSDDMWSYGASIGPASDGRIGVTFTHFYDQVYTTYTTSTTGYGPFSGTSNATPCIAGHFGLFFQMWDAGIFGNDYNPTGSVFENRCWSTTAKAMIIATAYQYPFTGLYHDKTRTHQGWGMPDVQNLYDYRNNFYIRDEVDVLLPLEVHTHEVTVEAGMPELKVVMVYLDPPGNPAVQSQHRINDLTLKVTSPSNTEYWGNNGLYEGIWSVPGGNADIKNTEEAVFIENPEAGLWTIEVQGNEIIQDSHIETAEIDADYALVVKGIPAPVLDVTIEMTPYDPPIIIPASGGSFDFNVLINNNEAAAASFDGWIMVQLPDLSWFGPVLGPINKTLPATSFIDKDRTQTVPATAPAGTYTYEGYVGNYPSAAWSSSNFTFEKSVAGDGTIVEQWLNTGESFDEELTSITSESTPTIYSLGQNYPNPFNPVTSLSFTLPEAGKVNLTVYDVNGRLITTLVDGYRQQGSHEVSFDGSGLASGVYFYQLSTGEFNSIGKMVLMK